MDLNKMEDPFEDADTEQGLPPPGPNPDVAPAADDEIAKLKAENKTLKNVQVTVMPHPPAAAPPRAMTQEELQKQAEDLGFTDPKQLESISKIAAHVAAPAYQKALVLEQMLNVERTVNAAKRAAQADDPQFTKLEPAIEEYLADIPPEDKLNPAKLKTHMERAIFFAKGKMGVASVTRRSVPPEPTPKSQETESDKGAIMTGPETWTTRDGKVSITIEPKISDKVRKMHRHPDILDAVQIDSEEEWRGPVFAKDLHKAE